MCIIGMFLLASTPTISALNIGAIKNTNLVTTDDTSPMTVRVDIQKTGYRKWDISVYVRNTLDEAVGLSPLLLRMAYTSIRFDIYSDESCESTFKVYFWAGRFLPKTIQPKEEVKLCQGYWTGETNPPKGEPQPVGKYYIRGELNNHKINGKEYQEVKSEIYELDMDEPIPKPVFITAFDRLQNALPNTFLFLQRLISI